MKLKSQDHRQMQLSLLAETIRLPKPGIAEFTERGLKFAPDCTEQDLLDIGGRLFVCRGHLKWMLGSLLSEMLHKRPHPDARNHPKEFETEWVSEFCLAHQIDPKERREMVNVFTFYRYRATPALSYSHHLEAMVGVADNQPRGLDRAVSFLELAHERGMSLTQLRAHIRAAQRTSEPPQQMDGLADWTWTFDARRCASRNLPLLHTFTPERARLILEDLGQETLIFIDALRRLAISDQDGSQPSSNQQARA